MTRFRARVASFFQKCESTLVPIVKLKHKRRVSVATDGMRIPSVVTTPEPVPSAPFEVDGIAPPLPTLSPLLQLPVELQLDIIETVNKQYQEDKPLKTDPLFPLRLTCKRLAFLCAPILFRSLRLEEVDLERLRRLADNSRTLGKFVRDLTITVQKDVVTDWELRMYQMLPHMPNVRSLTVVHDREDTQYHSLLCHFVAGYQYLEHITLREANYNPIFSNFDHPSVEISHTFFHCFLQTVLNAHAARLQTLHLYTLLPLRPPVYIKIRDRMPRLRALTLTTNIDVALRDLFADSTPWASGKTGSLERLTLHECGGAHVGNFARNVLQGVYGPNLKDVNIIACGDNSDIPFVPPSSTPVHASIERMQVDHLGPWELSALSLVPTQDISFTRMPPESIVELTVLLTSGLPDSDVRKVGFPGCERIRMNPDLAPGKSMEGFTEDVRCGYEGLQDRCQRREIQCTWDAVVWGNCLCHSHV